MKKVTIVFVTILCMLFSGCNSSKKDNKNQEAEVFTVYDNVGASTVIGAYGNGTVRMDASWDNKAYEDLLPHEKSITVNDEVLVGNYRDSYINDGCSFSFVQDEYMTENAIYFSTRRNDGGLCYINYQNTVRQTDITLDKPVLSEKELSDTAKNFAIEYAKTLFREIENVEVYEQRLYYTGDLIHNFGNEGDGKSVPVYTFLFTKKINGIDSTDSFQVRVTSKGTFVSFMVGDIGAFSNIKIDITSENLNQYIETEINEIYSNNPLDFVLDEYSVSKQTFAISPEGEVVLVTTVNGMGHREESNEQDLETLAKLKTVLLQKENG